MKLPIQENQEIVIGAAKEMMFSIDDSNPIIFDILRNKMYSNKIAAICREVASNSRDANREANIDEHIEIEFTNSNFLSLIGDTSVIFRDNGIGISPDRMEDVFLKYAASTKRSTNTQTGGFGLGAKTPFAYTDSFVVRTISENTEYVYNAIIDATGKGKMILLSEEFSPNPSGTEIIIPILSNEDRMKFEAEVYRATMYWGNVKYINFNSAKPATDYVLEGENFKITPQNRYGAFVGLLDGIPYDLKTDITGINGYTVFLNLDLNQLTINANRESLQYDEQTTRHVAEVAEKFKKELGEKVHEYLSDNKSFTEAYKKFKKVTNSHLLETNFEKLVYNLKRNNVYGLDFNTYFEGTTVEKVRFSFHTVFEVTEGGKGFKYEPTSFNLELPVVYYDKGRINLDKNGKLGRFLFIKPSKVKEDKEKVEKEKEYLFGLGINIINYSDVKPDKVFQRSTASDKVRIFTRGGDDPRWDKQQMYFDKQLKVLDKHSTDTTFFIPVSNVHSHYYGSSKYDSKKTLLRFEKKTINVFYVSETNYEKYLKPNGYLTLDEKFKEIDLSKYEKYASSSKVQETIDQLDKTLVKNFPEILPKSFAKLTASMIPQDLRWINWGYLGVKGSSLFDYKGFIDKYNEILDEKYPMLRPYLRHSYEKEDKKLKTIKDYINLINKKC